jgi:FtsH-binding integral membrane protein
MKILTVLLLLLITVSALTAVAMRDVSDLIVGVGSLVIGIWGVRSILVPQPIPVVTSVDLALSVVILFVLLGLLLRGAQQLQRTAEIPSVTRRTKKE